MAVAKAELLVVSPLRRATRRRFRALKTVVIPFATRCRLVPRFRGIPKRAPTFDPPPPPSGSRISQVSGLDASF